MTNLAVNLGSNIIITHITIVAEVHFATEKQNGRTGRYTGHVSARNIRRPSRRSNTSLGAGSYDTIANCILTRKCRLQDDDGEEVDVTRCLYVVMLRVE